MKHVLKTFEDNKWKLTVEELSGFEFISTRWSKMTECEVDREVRSFETFGGALDDAFDTLAAIAKVKGEA